MEELGLEYVCHEIDMLRGDQLKAGFLKINPINKQSAIVDHDVPVCLVPILCESCVILVDLAENRFDITLGSRFNYIALAHRLGI